VQLRTKLREHFRLFEYGSALFFDSERTPFAGKLGLTAKLRHVIPRQPPIKSPRLLSLRTSYSIS
jgi:hypothetical protein